MLWHKHVTGFENEIPMSYCNLKGFKPPASLVTAPHCNSIDLVAWPEQPLLQKALADLDI
jgi:hypothetical protein